MGEPMDLDSQQDASDDLTLSAKSTAHAIEELKRRGKGKWGASYYSQPAPIELCELAGRPRQVQYGALISWLKRLESSTRPVPAGAIALVAHLTNSSPEDCLSARDQASLETPTRSRLDAERRKVRPSRLEVNCPSAIHDHRFVLVGELPDDDLHPVVLVQPLDGTGYWYPQVARHNPLRAGRAFACFVQLGNPVGVWHVKPPPLDAKIRVLALARAWSTEREARMTEDEAAKYTAELGVIDQRDVLTSRVSTTPLAPSLRDGADFSKEPLMHDEPQAHRCVAPLVLDWKGGAAYIEVRQGEGDNLIFEGSAAPGATLTLRGAAPPTHPGSVLYELPRPGRYRLRLYPSLKSFVDPPYEWWLEVS